MNIDRSSSYEYLKEKLDPWFSKLCGEKIGDQIPEIFAPLSLQSIEGFVPSPWGGPISEMTDQILSCARVAADLNEGRRQVISLSANAQTGSSTNTDEPFLITPATSETGFNRKPAVIIVPGGGYDFVSYANEGCPVLEKLEREGFQGFIFGYRTKEAYPAPFEDLAQAIRLVREDADAFGIDPQNVSLVGFSAGAHLCASFAELYPEFLKEGESKDVLRPDALALGYPVITMLGKTHLQTMKNITGGVTDLREKLSAEKNVTEDFPRTMIWTVLDDDAVSPDNSRMLHEALDQAGVENRLEIYPSGGHGCGLAWETPAEGWTDEMAGFLKIRKK